MKVNFKRSYFNLFFSLTVRLSVEVNTIMLRKFSKVREKDHQEEWLQNMSDQHRKQFAYFIKMLEKGEV